jgi:hypothetical protein
MDYNDIGMHIVKKRKLFILFFLVMFVCSAFGQEKKTFSLGLLTEANANTRHGYGLAGGLMGTYSFTDYFAMGIKADYGTDFYDVSSAEALGYGRIYFNPSSRFPIFLQLGAGAVFLFEDNRMTPSVLGDGSLGIRFSINNFYTEQYIRFGWPTGFGFGLSVGYKFGKKPVQAPPITTVNEPEEYSSLELPDPAPLEAYVIIFPSNAASFDATVPGALSVIENNIYVLMNLANFMRTYPEFILYINGHANPVEKTAEEEAGSLIPLSQQRAEYVRNRLINYGVSPDRLHAFGAGSQGTETDNAARNRRVEFRFELIQ